MDTQKYITITVKKEIHKKLLYRKVHPNQSFGEVIERLMEKS